MQHDVDVLVVGAGPVGLTAAVQLARSGVRVRLVDAADGPATTSRALGAHARSLELYDQMGLLGDIASHGTRVNAFVRHQDTGTSRVDFEFGALRTQFPYMFNVDQVVIERVLRAAAASAGVVPEWGVELTSFEQDDDGVTSVLHVADGADGREQTVRSRYLWGCDGGHSAVRKQLGLKLEGESAHTWLIADAVVDTDLDRDGVHWLFPRGSTMMLFPFPEPGKWRLLDTSGDGDPENLDAIAAQLGDRLSAALDRTTTVARPTWASKFTIQQRAVRVMHVGRCFVSGDAAHVHSPASGQGLNTGVQDAIDLAWKLAMVVAGQAGPALLDTYDAERVPIGQALLASTQRVMATTMTDADGPDVRQDDLGFMRGLIRNMSGLALGYQDSPLTIASTAEQDGPATGPDGTVTAPRPGERLTQVSAADAAAPGWTMLRSALRTPGWMLLWAGQGAPDAPRAWIDVVPIEREPGTDRPHTIREPGTDRPLTVWDPDGRVHDTLRVRSGDWVLVRPDGYLSARGTGVPALDDALARLDTVLGTAPDGSAPTGGDRAGGNRADGNRADGNRADGDRADTTTGTEHAHA